MSDGRPPTATYSGVHEAPMSGAALAMTRAQAHRLAAHLRLTLLAVPAVLFLTVVLFVPLANLLSLGVASGTFAPYQKALGDPLYLSVIGLTFSIALATAVICLLLGYPVALLLASSRGLVLALGFICVLLPFWTSLLVRTYAWMALLGRNWGHQQMPARLGFDQRAAASAL
jgi:ABC-type spermidine/putrescine transport system permease subunit I